MPAAPQGRAKYYPAGDELALCGRKGSLPPAQEVPRGGRLKAVGANGWVFPGTLVHVHEPRCLADSRLISTVTACGFGVKADSPS